MLPSTWGIFNILLLCILLLMCMWDCQKEIQVFIVLFRIRLFHFPILKHLSEQVLIFISFLDWTCDPLCYPLVRYMGFLSKFCWQWPIYLAVGDWQKAGGCEAKCSVEMQACPLGAFGACTGVGWLVSSFEQTFIFCTGAPRCPASGCMWRGVLGMMSGLHFICISTVEECRC